MAGGSKRPQLKLSDEEVERLKSLHEVADRAVAGDATGRESFLRYHAGESVTEIAKAVGMKYYPERRDPEFEAKMREFCWFIRKLRCRIKTAKSSQRS